MTMSKISKKTCWVMAIGLILLISISYGICHMIQHINGTTPAQIEARQRANEAAAQTTKALNAEGQWHQDMMSEPVSVTNSNGVTKTYQQQASPVIHANE